LSDGDRTGISSVNLQYFRSQIFEECETDVPVIFMTIATEL
jgi:hypothetical protein